MAARDFGLIMKLRGEELEQYRAERRKDAEREVEEVLAELRGVQGLLAALMEEVRQVREHLWVAHERIQEIHEQGRLASRAAFAKGQRVGRIQLLRELLQQPGLVAVVFSTLLWMVWLRLVELQSPIRKAQATRPRLDGEVPARHDTRRAALLRGIDQRLSDEVPQACPRTSPATN
jgi:hypothetical protein